MCTHMISHASHERKRLVLGLPVWFLVAGRVILGHIKVVSMLEFLVYFEYPNTHRHKKVFWPSIKLSRLW